MKPITGDLTYELLARGSHHSHHYHHTGTYGGGGDGVIDWGSGSSWASASSS
ncbi:MULTISPECIES: hypothetical protein [Streptomyces]|uniref:hypothetical protein n=1 Tax=Streptomyces TaxID=1883 RepID=UPI001F2A5EB9|nr:hypothetical protein [Streptomyces sp. 9-7]